MIKESTPLNWDEKVDLCQQWQASGLSMNKFCNQKNIAISTFSGWCSRLWPYKNKKSKLCEVAITNQNNIAAMDLAPMLMTIELSFGHNITARVEARDGQIRLLLQELVHATTTIR